VIAKFIKAEENVEFTLPFIYLLDFDF